jgi:FMN-dependent NADH-azoreductase
VEAFRVYATSIFAEREQNQKKKKKKYQRILSSGAFHGAKQHGVAFESHHMWKHLGFLGPPSSQNESKTRRRRRRRRTRGF